nr:hypothetical protein [Tanacetum cinerariifolium]
RYAIKECSSCGTLYTRDCSCSKENVEEKILVPKPPKNCARCARCGYPVDGLYCQGCTFLKKKLEEDLVTHFQGFQNTFESSDDSTNNSPNDSPSISANSSHNPPHIDERCFECRDALDGIFCQRCACFDQSQPLQFPVIHPPPQETSIEILHDQEKVITDVQTFLRKFNRYSFFETPQELAEYINTPGWNRPTFYNNGDDDDVDYNITITPVLSIEEPDKSLSMGDEHFDTIPATESDELLKSSVEDLVPIPSDSE